MIDANRDAIARCEDMVRRVDEALERAASGPNYTAPADQLPPACQSALDRDPFSASKRDPFDRRVGAVAFAPPELIGLAKAGLARVV